MNREHAASISFQIHTFADLRENALLHICWAAVLWQTERASLNPRGPWLCPPDWTCSSPLEYNFTTSPNFHCKLPPSFQVLIQTYFKSLKHDRKNSEVSSIFPPNFVEEETNSLRFNLESICWQMHRAHPVGSHLENTDGKGATYQVWPAQGRPAWRPHKLGDQKSPHRMVWT